MRSEDAVDIAMCDELPRGWSVLGIDSSHGRAMHLVFQVDGDALVTDGILVQRILQRMGVL